MNKEVKQDAPKVVEVEGSAQLKQVVTIDVKYANNTFTLLLPPNATFGEAYNATFAMLDKIAQLLNETKEKARPKEAPEIKGDVVKN